MRIQRQSTAVHQVILPGNYSITFNSKNHSRRFLLGGFMVTVNKELYPLSSLV